MTENDALNQLRQQLNALDAQLIPLLEQRLAVVQQVGNVKAAAGLPANDPQREQVIIERLAQQVTEKTFTPAMTQIYQGIFAAAKDMERVIIKQEEAK
ncbi:chorismate mutase [Furfurilactobacillus siliginis]|uniref:Chorismate mutase domain-containing protein n=1 Tax=Furfurilactobacillus siliginis TaxID=348151 RepID=A0A0R2L798_9LACO|nr:chorismate mutase [Furfurilactobacillus siliginis]KRN95765.1 hypothetical protein IV55_GL001870 [Furfurilactobacillus siliginis]GEK28959.1 hypothetical protein LSI01_12700 [Furfurilactobacillus siliginis]